MTWTLIAMLAFFAACLSRPAAACLLPDKNSTTEARANKQLGCIHKPRDAAPQKTAPKKAAKKTKKVAKKVAKKSAPQPKKKKVVAKKVVAVPPPAAPEPEAPAPAAAPESPGTYQPFTPPAGDSGTDENQT